MEGDVEDSLDLSHLTVEERGTILQVLLRDSELRRRDEGRVRLLQQQESDPVRLRSLSGSWFSEERSKRHRNCRQGFDLVHSSIRRRKSKGKDVPLAEVFDGRIESPTPSAVSSSSLELGKTSSTGHQESLTPTPMPRVICEQTQHVQGSDEASLSSECLSRSNGCPATAEDDSKGHDGDTNSMISGLTEPYSTALPSSTSVNSIYSNYTLSGSMMSLFSSGELGVVEVKGRIQFSLVYNTQREELLITVCCCEDLASAHKNRSDPYVKTYLLPDKSSRSKKKTSVKKNSLNPVYDKILKYKVPIGEVRSRTLNLSVWHAESLGKNIFLGEVEVLLAIWDWASTQPRWYDLKPRVQLSADDISSRGTILLSIKFIPEGSEGPGLPLTGELHIWLREAQGLLTNKSGSVDSFVKCFILPDASRKSGQKTRTLRHSISPAYNHTMVYDGFHTNDLREACAELTVWQRDGLKTHPLGGVRLSPGKGQSYGEEVSWMDSTADEVGVWTAMIENPNKWIDTALPIRTNITHRPDS